MGQVEVRENTTRKIDFLPCVKCGSENIDFNDAGYSSFNVAWGRCRDCKHEVKINHCSWNITVPDIVRMWNKANDPEILRKSYQDQIDELQKKIEALPKQKDK